MRARQLLAIHTIAAQSTIIFRMEKHFLMLYDKETSPLFNRIYALAIKNTGTAKPQI
jgi:hypothetical protein